MASVPDTKANSTAETKTITPTIKDVAVDGKYNPGLFLQSQLGRDVVCQELIQRGMDTAEIRKMIHKTLISSNGGSVCSDLFKDRNHKASDFKLVSIETCSYCNKKVAPSSLLMYWTLTHVQDLLIQEFMKSRDEKTKASAVLKYFVCESLEAKVRDVRVQDGITVNAGCYLTCITRCGQCLENTKIVVEEVE